MTTTKLLKPAKLEVRVSEIDARASLDSTSLTRAEMKEVFKEGLKEWLSEQKQITEATIGRWLIRVSIVSGIFAFSYFMLMMNGWKHVSSH